MLKSIESYIITNGNGQQAVAFYKQALNAEIIAFHTFADNWPECPDALKDYVMNAQLVVNGHRLMVSDNNPMMADYQLGHQVSIALVCDDIETTNQLFTNLSVNAKEIAMPLQETSWSPAYGNLVDQFGVNWQITTEIEK